jgi:hypothetical protein
MTFQQQPNRRRIMKRTTLAALLGLGISGLACGTNDSDTSTTLTPDGLPPLTAEEQLVADNMVANTLAEIDLPEGKMKFIELSPGEVSILRQIRAGAQVTRVEGENSMTLDQIFRAYAPGREVPHQLIDAMGRVAAFERTAATKSTEIAGGENLFQGARIEKQPLALPNGEERVVSALTSTIDQGWFTNTFCNVTGADWTWCFAVAWQGAYASRTTHRSNSVTCGDTGAARVNFHVGGTLKKTLEVPYGQCWYTGTYHHSHGFLGYNNETGQKYSIPFAAGTVRFAGWNADNDQFIGGF